MEAQTTEPVAALKAVCKEVEPLCKRCQLVSLSAISHQPFIVAES
jgi:hypothetical protein